ncbi:MAG: hypothetical protein A2Y73_01395 [Chloroflexi bacterium RBG_13_56_8]|nr:MAG: hypothetical protein A2Y73_01395 [Chloroflexi bacterium RBG_13_56_8]
MRLIKIFLSLLLCIFVASLSSSCSPSAQQTSSPVDEEEGKTTQKEGPCANIPLYPGAATDELREGQAAELMTQLEAIGPSGEMHVYTTGDSIEDVHSFYREAMDEAGWRLDLEMGSDEGGLYTWQKDDLSAQLVTGKEKGQTVLLVGCGIMLGKGADKAKETPEKSKEDADVAEEEESPPPQYVVGDQVPFRSGTWIFEEPEALDRIPVLFEKEYYTPEMGKYVVVPYTFQGAEENETAGVDSAIYRLVDQQGREYSIDTDLWNYEINSLSMERDRGGGMMLLWSNPEPKEGLLVFDVPSDANTFQMRMIYAENNRIKTGAIIDLGEPKESQVDS